MWAMPSIGSASIAGGSNTGMLRNGLPQASGRGGRIGTLPTKNFALVRLPIGRPTTTCTRWPSISCTSSSVEIARHILLVCGLVLVIGTLAAFVAQKVKTPDVAIFLLAGIIIGPHALGLVHVRADSALVMSSTQDIYATRASVARMVGLPVEKVRVQYYEGSGTYGRSCYEDAAEGAAHG